MISYLLYSYLPALLATLVIEASTALLLGFRSRRQVLAVILVSIVTHPVLNLVILTAGYFRWMSVSALSLSVVALEVCVVAIEALLLMYALRLSARRAWGLSLVMNMASYLLGVLVPWLLTATANG